MYGFALAPKDTWTGKTADAHKVTQAPNQEHLMPQLRTSQISWMAVDTHTACACMLLDPDPLFPGLQGPALRGGS